MLVFQCTKIQKDISHLLNFAWFLKTWKYLNHISFLFDWHIFKKELTYIGRFEIRLTYFKEEVTYIGRFFVALVCPFEGVGYVVVAGALVHVQHLDVHRHCHCAPKITKFFFMDSKIPKKFIFNGSKYQRVRLDPITRKFIFSRTQKYLHL